ncbi:hypothetical protein [Bacillus safensis]|uniref:hypothetical protein n=1 Tax=Bacillus safensis TaxID=561879 RepID=UPI003000B097
MKPEITKEQAEAIEFLRKYYDDRGILELYAEDTIGHVHQLYGHDCGCVYDLDLIDFASALINGYEIAKSTEQKVRDYYEYLERRYGEARDNKDAQKRLTFTAKMDGVRGTLDHLGIKIEGVNS